MVDESTPDASATSDAAGLSLDGARSSDARIVDSSGAETSDASAWPPPWNGSITTCNLPDAGTAAVGTAPSSAAGTRIHARNIVLDDGSKLLWDFYDEGLGVGCVPQRAADGATRCLPHESTNVTGAYTDSNCKVGTAMTVPVCDGAKFLRDGNGHYLPIGNAIAAGPLYYQPTFDTCAPLSVPGQAYALDPALPDSAFVLFAVAREPLIPGVDAVVRVGADGSRVWLGELYDAEHDVSANLKLTTGGDSVLRTTVQVTTPAGCCTTTTPAPCLVPSAYGDIPASCSAQPSYLMPRKSIAERDGHVYALGPPIPTKYCAVAGPGCPSTQTPAVDWWSVGPEVPTECFLHAANVPFGAGRLTATAALAASVVFPVTYSGGPLATTITEHPYWSSAVVYTGQLVTATPLLAGIVDSATNDACTIVELDDGALHCVTAPSQGLFFTDDACTVPVGAQGYKHALDMPEIAKRFYHDDPFACLTGMQHRVFGLGALVNPDAPFATPVYFDGPPCTAAGLRQVLEATLQDAATFPVVNLVVE